MNEDDLIEEAASAWRPRPIGNLRYHPAWHDLSDEGREASYERTKANRKLEAALDPDGLSTTARSVLAKL